MKVALVCPYSLTLPGGVQGQVLGLARALRDVGVDAVVIGPCDGPPPAAGVISVGRSISLAANGSMAPIAPDPATAARTMRALRSERPDIVHLHEPFVPGPTLAALIGSGRPVIGTFHASGHVPFYPLAWPIVRLASRRMSARVAVSEDAQQLAQRWVGGSWEIVANGVDVAAIDGAEPWPSDRPTILFIGRHEQRKGLCVLLEAFAGIERDVTLWIGGEGPATDALRARGVSNVEWLGRIDDAELARRLRGATVFCAPSTGGESFGVVLLEAMAAGAPVVASDIAGYRRVARRDREAVLVPPGDADSLREALRRVLDDRTLAAGLVSAGAERARCFGMEGRASQYLSIYSRSLGSQANGVDLVS